MSGRPGQVIKLTMAQREAIYVDPRRPYRLIAADYGVDVSMVAHIKRDYQHRPKGKSRSAPAARKPLPERHYKTNWQEDAAL